MVRAWSTVRSNGSSRVKEWLSLGHPKSSEEEVYSGEDGGIPVVVVLLGVS